MTVELNLFTNIFVLLYVKANESIKVVSLTNLNTLENTKTLALSQLISEVNDDFNKCHYYNFNAEILVRFSI